MSSISVSITVTPSFESRLRKYALDLSSTISQIRLTAVLSVTIVAVPDKFTTIDEPSVVNIQLTLGFARICSTLRLFGEVSE